MDSKAIKRDVTIRIKDFAEIASKLAGSLKSLDKGLKPEVYSERHKAIMDTVGADYRSHAHLLREYADVIRQGRVKEQSSTYGLIRAAMQRHKELTPGLMMLGEVMVKLPMDQVIEHLTEFAHPAFVLCVHNLMARRDMSEAEKTQWGRLFEQVAQAHTNKDLINDCLEAEKMILEALGEANQMVGDSPEDRIKIGYQLNSVMRHLGIPVHRGDVTDAPSS